MKYKLDKSLIHDIPCAALYQPNIDCYLPSIIACFIMNDDWNKQALLELKNRVGADFIIGLQTDNKDFEYLHLVEGVIRCQPNEVQQVVQLLDISPRGLIAIDAVDIKYLFECAQVYQFIQVNSKALLTASMKEVIVQSLVKQLPKNTEIKGFLLGMESSESVALDVITHIIESIKNNVVINDLNSFYCTSITDEPDIFHLRAIYA